MSKSEELIQAMSGLRDERVLELVEQMVQEGYTQNAIFSCLNQGVESVGAQFEAGEYFIADLIVSGMIYRDALNLLNHSGLKRKQLPKGRIVIGVVEGDIHDIGKDIVVNLLRADGFEVIDLGIDVRPQRFCYAMKTYRPDVLMMSGILVAARDAMARTMDALRQENLRQTSPVLLGGQCASSYLAKSLGADGWAYDTMETVSFCNRVVEEKYGKI